MRLSRFSYILILISISLSLSGCFDDDISGGLEKTQVAAKVNGQEVTFSELNEYLKRVPVNTQNSESINKIKEEVLSSLVDQKLILNAAKEAKVDRSADVLNAIDMAKNKIIVDAFLNKVFTGSNEPSEQEIETFYQENSLIFNERKQFVYDQYILAADSGEVDALSNKVKLLDKSGQLQDFFDNLGRKYSHTREVRTSEQLPKQLVKAMDILKEKDIGFFKVSDGLVVIGLHKVESVPISLDKAKKVVQRELKKEKRSESVQRLVDSLRESAQIEYNPILDFVKNESEITK